MATTTNAKTRRRKPAYGGVMIGVCAMIAVVCAVGLWVWHRQSQIEEAQAWAPPGPACPTMTRQAYQALGTVASHQSGYEGVRFARAYGAVGCNQIASHGGKGPGKISVCQFNSPTTLIVTTKRGEFIYFTSAKPAVVTVADDTPTCMESAGEGMP
jgi:hypothetical protein